MKSKIKYEYAQNDEIEIRVTMRHINEGVTAEYRYLTRIGTNGKWLMWGYKVTGHDHLNVKGLLRVIDRYINFNYSESC